MPQYKYNLEYKYNAEYYIPFQNALIWLVKSMSHVGQYEAILTYKSDIDSTRENDVILT